MVAIKVNTLDEALNIIDNKDVVIFAGGTDLMVKYKNWSGLVPKINKDVLFIDEINELKCIVENEQSFEIGACCTLSELINDYRLPYVLREAASNMASIAVRNLATIGGNICNSSPAGDLLPPLYALNANIEIKSNRYEKIVPINEFILGPGKKLLARNEIVSKIIVENKVFDTEIYRKVGTRKSTALSKLSFILLCKSNEEGIDDIRIAFGAVGSTVVRNRSIEENIIMNGKMNDKSIENIMEKYSKVIIPITDQRSNKLYRKNVCLNLLGDALRKL